jgi:predicted site-specific integrase-resolvase
VTVTDDLVPTADAAKAIGVHRSTLAHWRAAGYVTAALMTPGGQARWDVDNLKRQLREQPPPDEP